MLHLLPGAQVCTAVIFQPQHQCRHALGLTVVVLAVVGDEFESELIEKFEQHQRGRAVLRLVLDIRIDEHGQQAQDGIKDGIGRDAVLLHEAAHIVPRERKAQAVVDDVHLAVADIAVAVSDVQHEFHD